MAIDTVDDLREHLETAITVELSTIPPYLYAMYSIVDQTSDAALLIRSVVVEEMLHAALVTNLLLGVGGEPDYRSTAYMPRYPGYLPHHQPPVLLELKKASPELIQNVFMVIEQPEEKGAPPEDDDYETLGQFYLAVEIALEQLDARQPLFESPQLQRQMARPEWYAPVKFDAAESGGLIAVTDLASAIEAIEIIVHQGEGLSDERWADPSHHELTHYHKFRQICTEGTLGSVRDAVSNPTTSAFPDEVKPVSDLFNAAYRLLYLVMDDLFQGTDQDASIGALYGIMSGVLSPVAHHLMAQPLGNEVAGPTFEPYEFGDDDPHAHLLDLAEMAARRHPALAPVVDAVGDLPIRSIDRSGTRA